MFGALELRDTLLENIRHGTDMPRSIDEGFQEFLAKLTPTSYESDAAKSHRSSILARLTTDFGTLRRFVRIGSFGNGTSISGHSDVDYLACLQSSEITDDSTYTLQKVRDSLMARFPSTGVRVSCPAVTCPFGTIKSEHTEIVPADYMWESSGYKVYDIPDCAGGWMKACPDAHNEYVNNINRKLDGKVKPLIRFIKAWKYFRQVPISSFYLEMRVAAYAQGETSIIYHLDIRNFLRTLQIGELADMYDPMGVSGRILACKSKKFKEDALSKLDTALRRADNACDAIGDYEYAQAFGWLRLLYNNEFPTYYY